MRVLFSGAFNPNFEALPEGVAAGIRAAGHEVLCFDHRSFQIPGRLRASVPALDRLDRAALNRRLCRRARRFGPQMLLVNQGSVVTEQTVRTIRRECGAVTVNWWSDYPAELETGLRLACGSAYDLFYVSGTDARDHHTERGARSTRWLPFGCDPEVHRPRSLTPEEQQRYACRVAFVGSAYPERRDMLARVADLGLGIWGPGWDRYREDPKIGPCLRGGTLRPQEWTRVFAAADVVLNISYGLGRSTADYGTMANVRVFEALACGACQLVDAKRDVLSLFNRGEHLEVFEAEHDLRKALIELLERPERREIIAEAGRREVLKSHTWRHRIERICSHAAKLSAGRFRGVAS